MLPSKEDLDALVDMISIVRCGTDAEKVAAWDTIQELVHPSEPVDLEDFADTAGLDPANEIIARIFYGDPDFDEFVVKVLEEFEGMRPDTPNSKLTPSLISFLGSAIGDLHSRVKQLEREQPKC